MNQDRPPARSCCSTARIAAHVTALLNGITVQENFELTGPTSHQVQTAYTPHADRMPLMLQEHGGSVQIRNSWLVPIDE